MPAQPSPYSDSLQPVSGPKTKCNRRNQHSSPVAAQPLRCHMYDLSILKQDTWDQKRPCWYCGLLFVPKIKSAWKSHFCCDPHRQAYNKYGSLPFDKIMLALREEIRKQIKEQTHAEVLAKAEPIIERRVKEEEMKMYGRLKKVLAAMVLDPKKAIQEMEALAAGVSDPGGN